MGDTRAARELMLAAMAGGRELRPLVNCYHYDTTHQSPVVVANCCACGVAVFSHKIGGVEVCHLNPEIWKFIL